MRQKRAKAYRKLMGVYSLSFGFRQPYQVLIDAEFCMLATAFKLDIVKQLPTVLQGLVKPMITQCCIHELYLSGKEYQGAVDLAKTFERRKCNHREAIPGDDCLLSVVGPTNKHRYAIASQSQSLRTQLRTIAAVPLVHFNRSIIVLEPPSEVTLREKQSMEEEALNPTSAPDRALIAASTPAAQVKKKRKGPMGPNPLSVKKKKPKTSVMLKSVVAETRAEVDVQDEVKASQKRSREDGGSEPHDESPSQKRKRRRRRRNVAVEALS